METLGCVFRITCFTFLAFQCVEASTIFVSKTGKDSGSCGGKNNSCQTLDFAFARARQTGTNSTQISVAKGDYSLKHSHIFTNVNNFGVVGEGANPGDVEIRCGTNVSVSFTLSENIFFEGVKLEKCGGWHPSSVNSKKPYSGLDGVKFKVALDFRYCRDIRFLNLEISSSPGLGVNCYDVGGVVNLTNCVFSDNTAVNDHILTGGSETSDAKGLQTERKEHVFSGGGIYMSLDPYGHNTVNTTPSQHDSYQHNNKFIFKNCSFLRNEAVWINKSEAYDFVDTPELPFNRGGGLAIYFRSNASGCNISIESCLFSSNRAVWGGGLQVEMKEETRNNLLQVKFTRFENNVGFLAGGGARLGSFAKGVQRRLNTFTVNNCSFVNNTAIWGGGASVYGSSIPGKCTDADVSQFLFNGCQLTGNTGTVGSAIGAFLLNNNEDQIGPEIPYHISINDSDFEGNLVIRMEDLVSIGEGALYSVEVPLAFRGNVTFRNNTRTAVALDGATMKIYGRVQFMNNIGLRGGAMAMYGRSKIVFKENSYLLFQGNQCGAKGGALYIDAPGPPLVSFNATGTNTHNCFFTYADPSLDYDDWKTKVVFRANGAPFPFAGNSIYATTLKSCRRAGEGRQNNSVLRWNFIEFRDENGRLTSVKNEVSTDPVDIQYDSTDWDVAPSELFNATLRLVDEIGNSVSGVVNVRIIPYHIPSSVLLHTPSPTFIANGSISYIRLVGEPGEKFSVELSYLGRQVLTETIPNRTIKSCNPGFKLEGSKCVCRDSIDDGISSCKLDGKTFFLKHGYWGGTVNGKFVTHFCPTGYCKTKLLASERMYNSNAMCNKDRDQKSVLCGECKANHSVLFGGENCSSKCSNWYLLLLLAYGLILLVVVMLIMLIDLDFFTGYLNAWLYSYQVMKVITPDGFKFDAFMEFVIGLANFQLKAGSGGVCFAKGLDDADKLVIMYALPTYVLLLVVLLAKAVGRYPNWCFSKRVKAAPFRALCTIVVLCYTDITRISLRILHPAVVGTKTVVYANGNIDFFTGKHLAYGILAILFIVLFVLPLPTVLLFRPSLTKGLRPILNLNRWKPIFDALQSCFKDQYRWCAAFYFICRFVLLVISTFVPSGPVKRSLLESCCVVILLTIAYLRPYKEAKDVKEDEESYDWINKSDAALLVTLTLIAVFSSPIDSSLDESTWNRLHSFVDAMAYIPLLVVVIVVVRSIRKCRETKRLRDLDEPELSVSELSDVTESAATQNSPA